MTNDGSAGKFLLAGASGFLGTALRVKLAQEGHQVVRLVRRAPATAGEFRWDPSTGEIDRNAFTDVDVVINLAGVGVADRPWTGSRRQAIRTSRTDSTKTLAEALGAEAAAGRKPIFIQGSATGWYGSVSGSEPFTEDAPAASDFLADVVEQWEAAAQPAVDAGLRTVFLRTSPVMDRSGGPLKLMKVPFALGLGSSLGDGSQHMAMITLNDWLRVVLWAVSNAEASGPYNLTIPQPCTNAEFTSALAAALHRPALLKVPSLVLRTALGELAEQLLGDQYIVPQRLLQQGFSFNSDDVSATVKVALAQRVDS